ncbi:hypothetical protein JST97_05900 [bacterium]|nr:hypothetical protein [bacterium]
MLTSVMILGFEPAIQSILALVLAREPGLTVHSQESNEPDVLLVKPESPEVIEELRSRFPLARFIAVLDWHRRSLFSSAPIDEYVDPLAGYEALVAVIKK